MRKPIATAVIVPLAAVAVGACGGDEDGNPSGTQADLPQGGEPVDLNPVDFSATG